MAITSHEFGSRRAVGVVLLVGLGITVAIAGNSHPHEFQAQPPENTRPELGYIPDDAGFFVYLNVAQLWDHPAITAMRKADPQTNAALHELLGESPDKLDSLILFIPRFKTESGEPALGIVLTFRKPYDAKRVKTAIEKVLTPNVKVTTHTPNDRTLVLLSGLPAAFARPRPQMPNGPLTGAIREAARGSHVLVVGATLTNLPDELRAADIPPGVEPFRPLFKADTITARVSVGNDIAVDVRVKTQTPAQALEAEKALGMLSRLLLNELDALLKELGMNAADPLLNDLITVLKAADRSLKGASYSVAGTEAKVVVRIPTDLPFPSAYQAAAQKVRAAADASRSANNLKQIALALHNYHDVTNSFPPAAVCDKSGQPLLSWRVLILPYIEESKLYEQFKLDEAWDSEHNKKLLAKMPRVYALSHQKPDDTTTHYRVFVGRGAAFDYAMGHKLTDFTDGTSNTAMVVTAAKSVPWTKPDELDFDPENDMTKLLGPVVQGRIQMAYADGSVRTLTKPPSRKTLNAIITRNGGEIFDDNDR